MKAKSKYIRWIGMLLLAILAVVVISCKDDDDSSDKVELDAYGPSPSPRGGNLTFIGTNLDLVTSIVFPDNIEVSEIEVISSDEIKAVVPQDAVVGYLKLVYADGEITPKTKMTYTEPISIEKISPITVKAGETLTIDGEYLNLISKVIFSSNIEVTSDEFSVWKRAQIQLVVPIEAKTGTIILSDTTSSPVEIESDTILQITLPSVSSVTTLNDKKPDDEITIAGANLDLVETVILPNDSTVEFNVSGNNISFTLPVGCIDGEIDMVAYSGVAVPIAQITMAVPTDMTVTPATGLRAGDEITISGTNMDLVTTTIFPGTEVEVVPNSIATDKITLTIPDAAISGDITLNTASGNTTSATIETLKPEVTSLSSTTPAPGDDMTIIGTNLDLVSTITFGGDQAGEISSQSATEIVVPVPTYAEDGAITLTMVNGEYITTTDALIIQTPAYCYIPYLPDTTIDAGVVFAIEVENVDVLTDVQVDGATTQYIINGSSLSLLVPSSSAGATEITLVSSNGSVSYEIDVANSGLVETVLYNEPIEITGWSGVALPYTVEVPLPANSKIRIRVSQANSELQVMDGYWGMGSNWAISDDAEKNIIIFSTEELSAGYVDMDFSSFHDENGDQWWDGKIMFNADGVTVSSVSLIVDNSAPTSIWEGSFDLGSWSGLQDLAWGGYDWSTVSADQTLYFTFTMNEGNTWGCLSLRHGQDWGNLPTESSKQIDFGSSDTEGTYTLTQADIEDLVANGGLVVTGANLTLTDIAIK